MSVGGTGGPDDAALRRFSLFCHGSRANSGTLWQGFGQLRLGGDRHGPLIFTQVLPRSTPNHHRP